MLKIENKSLKNENNVILKEKDSFKNKFEIVSKENESLKKKNILKEKENISISKKENDFVSHAHISYSKINDDIFFKEEH